MRQHKNYVENKAKKTTKNASKGVAFVFRQKVTVLLVSMLSIVSHLCMLLSKAASFCTPAVLDTMYEANGRKEESKTFYQYLKSELAICAETAKTFFFSFTSNLYIRLADAKRRYSTNND